MVTWRLFMFVYGGPKTVYVDLVLWRSLLDRIHWVRIVFFLSPHGFTFSVAYGVQLFVWLYRPSTYHLKKCSEYLYLSSVRSLRLKPKKKKKAALAASLEWMHLIIWAPIGGSVGIVTTSILSSGAGTMGLRDSVCCVQSSVPGLLSASAILSKLGA